MEARTPEEHNTGGHDPPRVAQVSSFVPSLPRRDGTCLHMYLLGCTCGCRVAHGPGALTGAGLAGWLAWPGTHCLQHWVVDNKDHRYLRSGPDCPVSASIARAGQWIYACRPSGHCLPNTIVGNCRYKYLVLEHHPPRLAATATVIKHN